MTNGFGSHLYNSPHNRAAYIAAASPDKVLALLAEIERLRVALEAIVDADQLSKSNGLITEHVDGPFAKLARAALGGK